MSKWIFLSYPLSPETPVYGGGGSLKIEQRNSIEKGDSCNTSIWSLPNHLGTHIDCPCHFVQNGKTLSEYPPEFWIFLSPFLYDISPIDPGTIIKPENFNFENISGQIDLLLIKTGFCNLRQEAIYWDKNPGFDPSLAALLRAKFPHLRVIGFDTISLSSFVQRELGRKAHKAFLDLAKPILPLEDMNLTGVNGNTMIDQVIVAPLYIKEADGAPCTVLAKTKD